MDNSFGKKWTCLSISNAVSDYISLELFNSPSTSLLELVLYGTLKDKRQPLSVTPKSELLPPIVHDYLMGTNAYGWTLPTQSNPNQLNLSGIVGSVREYQEWAFTEGGQNINYPGYPNNENRFQCSAQGNFCLDTDYDMATSENLRWHQVLMNTPNWVHNWNNSRQNWKPVTDAIYFNNGATMDPKSYVAYADHAWQTAARYGRTIHDNKTLKLAPNISLWDSTPQPILTGINKLDWIELWNEPNCWWTNRNEWFSAIEVNALQSAGYDGHCKSINEANGLYTVGVKNADITMNVSLGGLANDTTILARWKTMLLWSQYYRNASNCVDVFPGNALNVHFYANKNEDNIGGISPEEYNVYDNLLILAQWRDNNLPNIELWVTEYGYDSNSQSPQGVPSIGQYNSEQVQGMWILRSILSMSAVQDNSGGIQRAHQFMWPDVGSESSQGRYGTSGLVSNGNTPKQKVSYYYFGNMYNVLKSALFVKRDCNYNNGNVCIQEYKYENNNDKYAWVVWCPTSNDKMVNGFQVNVGNGYNTVMLITPLDNDINGNITHLSVGGNGIVTIDVVELPQYILAQ